MCHSISRALFCVKQSGFEVAIDSFIDRTEYTSKKKRRKTKASSEMGKLFKSFNNYIVSQRRGPILSVQILNNRKRHAAYLH